MFFKQVGHDIFQKLNIEGKLKFNNQILPEKNISSFKFNKSIVKGALNESGNVLKRFFGFEVSRLES